MNRKARRLAEKKGRLVQEPADGLGFTQKPQSHTFPVVADSGKPSLLLRIFSRILLSNFVISRVRQPEVLRLLGDVARQSGRMDSLLRIQSKLQAFDAP